MAAYRRKHGLTFRIANDVGMKLLQRFGFDAIPANVLIDRSGVYVAKIDSMADAVREIRKRLK